MRAAHKRSVFDAPGLVGVSIPAGEGLAIEEGNFCGAERAGGKNQGQNEE